MGLEYRLLQRVLFGAEVALNSNRAIEDEKP